MNPEYVYAARLIRVIDGDTYELDVDVGFRIHHHIRGRLRGVDTPEMKGATLLDGLASKREAEAWFDRHAQLKVRTHKPEERTSTDSFGRWLVDIHGVGLDGEHVDLAQHLLATHHAVLRDK